MDLVLGPRSPMAGAPTVHRLATRGVGRVASERAAHGGATGGAPTIYADPYPPAVSQFDPAVDFEPPDDLPPWYEDEYYDDRDWERLPRGTSTIFRVMLFLAGFLTIRRGQRVVREELDRRSARSAG